MFFKKKQPKIDPKVRFQNRQFNQKLQQARTFKRTVKQIPEDGFRRFLVKIGLGSFWRQAFLVIIIGGIGYLLYIPNFLTVQNIVVVGMSESEASATKEAIIQSLDAVPFYNPQRNLLVMSNSRIEQAAMQVVAVHQVSSIRKDFATKTVTVNILSKYERFLTRSTDSVFDVYNDGSTKGVAGLDRNSWESIGNPSMVKVDVPARITNADNKEFFAPITVDYINRINDELKGITGSSLGYIRIVLPEFGQQIPLPPAEEESGAEEETDADAESETIEEVTQPEVLSDSEIQLPLRAAELELIFKKGPDFKRTFRVIIDANEDPRSVVDRLNLLLSQTAPDRYDRLSYIDLRIQTRAFVCLTNTPCTR